MTIRRIALLSGAAFAALAMAITAAPVAHADGGTSTTNGNGSAWFESYGDHLTVNDWAPDGHGVRARIYPYDSGRPGEPVRDAYNGKGYHASALHKNYNLPEDRKYTLEVCLVDGPTGGGFACDSETIHT